MENKLANVVPEQEQPPRREIGIITAEIRDLCRQAQTMALLYAVEIGRRLAEAKETLPHGAWGDYLRDEVEFSQSTANNFMRLFEEYGTAQISIFGASVNSQTFANLPYSKALRLLAIPREEREDFAEEVQAESLSTRELKEAIEERNRAKREAEEALAREREIAHRLAEAEKAAENATQKTDEARKLKEKLDIMTRELQKAKENALELSGKLKKAEEDPKLPKAALDKLRKEAEAAARRELENDSDELEEARESAKRAEKEAEEARRDAEWAKKQLEEAQKRIQISVPEVTAFKTLFDSMQESASKLKGMIETIRKSDEETASKLERALKAFGERL